MASYTSSLRPRTLKDSEPQIVSSLLEQQQLQTQAQHFDNLATRLTAVLLKARQSRCSMSLLYSYKRTNTDAVGAGAALPSASPSAVSCSTSKAWHAHAEKVHSTEFTCFTLLVLYQHKSTNTDTQRRRFVTPCRKPLPSRAWH